MHVTNLPDALKMDGSSDLQVFDYQNTEDILKAKIFLSKNTISILRIGTKEVVGDDKAVQIDNQRFLIMKSGNCLMTEKISNSKNIYQSILLFFSDEVALEFLEKHALNLPHQVKQKSFYDFKYDDFIQRFVAGLEEVLKLPEEVQGKILKAKFEEIMLYLTHRGAPRFLNAMVQAVDDKISRLTNIVANNRYNKLSLEELAFLCNMSVSTFKRAFFMEYQQTPIKWFKEQRLDHAAFLLKNQRCRPIELYEDAGYESFSNFVQAFKKKFGKTPKRYQNAIELL